MKKGKTYLWVRKMMQGTNKRKAYYNKIPVCYCSSCLSLGIIDDGSVYCNECGETSIGECSINEWLSMTKTREQQYEYYE